MPRVITTPIIADFRKRLTEAAAELLAERGDFNMRELAKRLQVSPMTAYRYFKDKREILGALRARGFARLADALEQARAGADWPIATLQAYVRFALEDPTTYRLMFDLFQPEGAGPPDLAAHQHRVREIMNGLAGAGPSGPAAQPSPGGDMPWSALHGAVALYLAAKLDRPGLDGALGAIAALVGSRDGGPWRAREPFTLQFPAALTAAE